MSNFLDLLYADAPRSAYDDLLRAGADPEQHALALKVRERLSRHRSREAELSALYDTANDLAGIRDLDAILAAIVRRARQLLHADMTYLSLNDEEDGASYMKVTDGALTAEFRRLRLPLGTGLLGLVAQTGEPYFTEDYQADARFLHRRYIDDAVAGENIRAILGVPLYVDGKVIGALLAVHREVRPFPAGEVTLLTSFAAHAAVALENARLFEQARSAVEQADEANAQLRARTDAVEAAARVHDRLTDVLLHGGGVAGIADVLADVIGGPVDVLDDQGSPLTPDPSPTPAELPAAIEEARTSGHSAQVDGCVVAVAAAGEEHLGTLIGRPARPLDEAERRSVERAAIVTALVLLFGRTEAEAEERVRGELLTDLLSGREVDPEHLRERARRQRIELEKPYAIAVLRVADPHRAARTAARAADAVGGLVVSHDGTVVVAAPDTEPLELGRHLADRLTDPATIGVATAADLGGLGDAYADARRCVEALVALGREGEVSDSAHLGLAHVLLGGSPDALEEFVDAALGRLIEYDDQRGAALVPTLEAWFDHQGSLRAIGNAMHVHPNTVGQRLERICRVLGADWREPNRALDLQVALRLRRLRDGLG